MLTYVCKSLCCKARFPVVYYCGHHKELALFKLELMPSGYHKLLETTIVLFIYVLLRQENNYDIFFRQWNEQNISSFPSQADNNSLQLLNELKTFIFYVLPTTSEFQMTYFLPMTDLEPYVIIIVVRRALGLICICSYCRFAYFLCSFCECLIPLCEYSIGLHNA